MIKRNIMVSELINEVLEGVKPTFETHEFILNKKNREFIRETKDAIQIVDLNILKNGTVFKIRPEIRIKVKRIEAVYHSITAIENRPFLTLGNHLFEIIRYIDSGEETGKKNIYDWSIEDQNDIDKLIKIIPDYLVETILPYFEENSSVERVDYLLNKYPRELSVHNYLYPLRVNVALIAAKLNGNPEFKKLSAIYDEEMQGAEETYKTEFLKLKELLQYHPA